MMSLRRVMSLRDEAWVAEMTDQAIADGQPPDADWPDDTMVSQFMQARAAGIAMLELAVVRFLVACGMDVP